MSTATSRTALRFVVAVVAASFVVACGSAPAPPPAAPPPPPVTVIAAPVLKAGEQLPAPQDGAVLTLTGRITAPNTGSTLQVDQETLDRLGVLKIGVFEPWIKKDLEFQGVWLADLLAVAGVDPAAQSLHLTALDDYQIDMTTASVAAGGVFLATKNGDGSPIPVADGGPVRIVYQPGSEAGTSADQWIWSLATIDVR